MIFDVAIIGLGMAGSMAALKLAKDHKEMKILGIDGGAPPAKRRAQLCGYLGSLPFSDGKFYQSNLTTVSDLVGIKKTKNANSWFTDLLSNIDKFSIIKDKGPSQSAKKRLNKNGYEIILNDYFQMFPKNIHALSRFMVELMETNNNLTFSFNNEVQAIQKQKNIFILTTEIQEFKAKKIIFAVGRAGWRWAGEIFSKFGIIDNNDIAKFGICLEINSTYLKDFNKSTCTLTKNNLEIGPFSWEGTIIPEDHYDMAISSFRSNEDRWQSDKTFFNLIGNIETLNYGYEQTDRLANLTFILTNERVAKEKLTTFMSDRSKISIIPEYKWIKESILQLDEVIPDLLEKSYFHFPTINPMAPKINLGNNFETEISGMYVVGESAGMPGLLGAAVSGIICADEVCK